MFWAITGVAVLGAALWGPVVSDVEQAKYTVLQQQGEIELRRYEPMIVAQAQVSGERDVAIRQGFRTIADYIFGNNIRSQNVEMTAPVIQQPASEKIAMTAPVRQVANGNAWNVQFVMPSEYTLATLPKPNNNAVKLKEIPAKTYAVIRFSGMGSDENLQENTQVLEHFVHENRLKPFSAPIYAFFNPPWTLPFLRRNEVMIEVK